MISAIQDGTGWAKRLSDSNDRLAKNAQMGRQVFTRELPGTWFDPRRIKGWNAPPDAVGFVLKWKGTEPPKGSIHLYRSGRHDWQPLACNRVPAKTYNIVTTFDLAHGKPIGDCS